MKYRKCPSEWHATYTKNFSYEEIVKEHLPEENCNSIRISEKIVFLPVCVLLHSGTSLRDVTSLR
jgi:hypothetical protein